MICKVQILWQNVLNTVTNVLTQVSAPVEDRSQQSVTFTHALKGPTICKQGKAETHPNPNGRRARHASPFTTRKESSIGIARLRCWLKKQKRQNMSSSSRSMQPWLQITTMRRLAFLICRSARFLMRMSKTRSAQWR
jgi:hypothetical protein